MRTCFLSLLLIAVLALAGAAYALAGPPRDLGIRHTEADLQSAQDKLNQQIVSAGDVAPAGMLVANPVDTALTQEEYSAHVEQVHPLGSVQIRFEGDQFEMSGRIERARIPAFLRGLGFDVDDAEVLDVVNSYFPFDPTFYFAGTGSVNNSTVVIDLSAAELGRLPIPIAEAEEYLRAYHQLIIDELSALQPDNVSLENAQLTFEGTTPSQLPEY